MKPITPKEALSKAEKDFPAYVFECFNKLIVRNLSDDTSVVEQDEVLKMITSKSGGLSRQTIIDNGWLDVEAVYRKAGWKVEYDKPGFNEDYSAAFTFTAKRKR